MNKIWIRLKKIKSKHDNLRTDSVEGWISKLPEVGEGLILWGESINTAGLFRMVSITPVIEFQSRTDTHMEFKTRNSTYSLEVLSCA